MWVQTKDRNWLVWGTLGAIVALAAWLRLHGIANKSFWTDEGVSAAFTKLDWYELGRILWRREGNMTLYYLLLRAWTHMGDSVALIRGLSVVWSVGAVVAIFVLGRRLYGSAAGLAAALLLTVNAYSVRYAQEARSYSMVTCLVTLATLLLVRAVEASAARSRQRQWTWYVIASVLGVYAHFFAMLVVAAHGAVIWGALPDRKREFTSAAKKIAVCTLPAIVFIAKTGTGPIGWIPRLSAAYVAAVFRQFTGNGGWPLVALYLVGAMLFLWLNGKDWKGRLLISWWMVPWGLTLAVALVKPIFLGRYMIVCLPALVLIVARGITSIRRWWIGIPVLGAICWLAIGGVRSYYANDFDISREDLRAATEYVLAHAGAGDVIAFHKGQNRFAFSYYADHMKGTRPRIVYPGGDRPGWLDFFDTPSRQVLALLVNQDGRVWLVVSSQTLSQPGEDATAQQIERALGARHRVDEVKDVSHLKIYRYDEK
jgi:mannosyltransferase